MTAVSQLMQRDPTNSNRRHSFGVLTSSSSAALNAPYAASQSGKAPSANATALSLSRSMSIASNAGGPMRRSHSKSTLFNEDVLEVSLLKSPARNTNIRAPYQPGVQGSGSDRAPAHGHAQQEVAVLDRLQGQERELWVKVDPTHTVEYLKTRIQSRQGQEGRRIIPAHIQVLIFDGRERDDNEMVWDILSGREGGHAKAVFMVEPRVNELVSWFLASVSDFSGQQCQTPKADRQLDPQLSPTTSCADASFALPVERLSLNHDADADSTLFFGEGMEGVGDCISMSPSTPSSPRSVPSPAAPLSPVLGAKSSMLRAGPDEPPSKHARYRDLQVEVGSPDVLSAETTPTADVLDDPMCQDRGLIGSPGNMEAGSVACSFDGISLKLRMQCAGSPVCTPTRTPSMVSRGVLLDMVELRKVNKENTKNNYKYSSESHILFRGSRTACMNQLDERKFHLMNDLVLEVQSGLRHGHVPEELSTSGRDSLSLHTTGRDSVSQDASWEEGRASWWEQHQGDTDFDYGDLVQNCCGGTYMMRNKSGAQTAVFKPTDEEPYAPSNPKGFTGMMDVESGMKAGVTVGGGAARECAAFLLDHDGRGGVPCTAMLRITHTTLQADRPAEVQMKVGSLQRFQLHDCTAEDVGTARFDPTQVHSIGVLDVRTFNMDRNSDNVLVKMASTSSAPVQLVPIDHGYILPSYKHLEEVHACWLYWPQAKEPYSEDMLEYLDALDAEKDLMLLRSTLTLPEDCLLTLFIGTTLIQTAAREGLTLHDTGMLLVREAPDRPSAIEEVVSRAVMLAESDGFVSTGVCEDFYASVKMHLTVLIGQLIRAHQLE